MRFARSRSLPPARLLAAAAALLLASAPAAAQTVRGQVVEADGNPVSGMLVGLVDAAGVRHDAALSDSAGAFTVRARGAGSYRLRAERVGFMTTVSGPITLGAGETVERRMTANIERIMLPPVTAHVGRRACTVRPRNGEAAATVWEEARKALASAALASERQAFAYRLRMHTRRLTMDGVPGEEQVQVTAGFNSAPFVATPVERLVEHGYVEDQGDSILYHAPDANTLLSDAFLDHHCFSLTEGTGPNAGLVGLEFSPLRGRRMADVQGTLWLNRGTGLLSHIEYHYTGLPYRGAGASLGGRIVYERLPRGAWIVRRWYIRMPLLMLDPPNFKGDRPQPRVHALYERGGEVLDVRPVGRAADPGPAPGELTPHRIRTSGPGAIAGAAFASA
ncbi:MAG TPA: carboxypeptidase-like regulatory domain-containing protein, partial [Longimicrobium sp.]|nr:carboxypeptidase-like regulatory domain-containing protein [Longimicrobium sp.]